jgi:cell division protein FtsZ
VGEDAEIIFGAVHEPAMQGEIRVTVIATGFDRPQSASVQVPNMIASQSPIVRGSPVIPLRPTRANGVTRNTLNEIPRRIIPTPPTGNPPVTPERDRSSPEQDLSDMEIPTFIRRQMD